MIYVYAYIYIKPKEKRSQIKTEWRGRFGEGDMGGDEWRKGKKESVVTC